LTFPVLLVTEEGEIRAANQKALSLAGKPEMDLMGQKGGDFFQCVNANLPGGCGRTVHCPGCTVRNTVLNTFETGEPRVRVPATLTVEPQGNREEIALFVTTEKVGDRVLIQIERP
jgi:hypothetical protein